MNGVSLFSAMLNENPKTASMAPKELVEFRSLDKYAQRKSESDGFFQQPFLQEFLEDKWKAELHNRSTFLWAHELYMTMPEGDEKDKIEVKLKQFKNAIEKTDHPYLALHIDFTKYPFTNSLVPVGATQVDWND